MSRLTEFHHPAALALFALLLIRHPTEIHAIPSALQAGFLADSTTIGLSLIALDLSRPTGPTAVVVSQCLSLSKMMIL